MNYMRTALLLAAMTGLFLAVGYMLGGTGGMIFAFLFAVFMNGYAWWNSDKLVLRMQGARPVSEQEAPRLYATVRHLSQRAGLPMPKVYLIDQAQPNAFATGRNPENAAVAATTGLLQMLDSDEVEGVMAHELAHIKNRDTTIMTLTAMIAGAISMLANFALFFGGNRDNHLGFVGVIAIMVFAPMAALLVQMAISRTREFSADRGGAEISGKPRALASALKKLHQGAHMHQNDRADANPATAHLFIINPLSGKRMGNLFSTHPDTGERIAALEALTGKMGGTGYSRPFSGPTRPSTSPPASPRRTPGTSVPSSGRKRRP